MRTCVRMPVVCVLLPASSSSSPSARARRSCRARPPWPPSRAASSSWGRSRRRPRASGSIRACAWGRRWHAARGWPSSRPIPSAWPMPGSACWCAGGGRRAGRARPPGAGLLRGARAAAPAWGLARRGARRDARDAAPGRRRRGAPGRRPVALLRDRGRRRAGARPAGGVRRGRRRPGRRARGAAAPPPELAALPEELERLGIATLGALAALPRGAVADRFGRPGLLAHDLAAASTRRWRRAVPARSSRRCSSSRSPPRAASSSGRWGCSSIGCSRGASATGGPCASVVVGATLVEGGTWRERVVFREPLSDAGRMRLVLAQRLALLPAPAESLRLSAMGLPGPP